jgi:sortase (surface protein transpeptidase)
MLVGMLVSCGSGIPTADPVLTPAAMPSSAPAVPALSSRRVIPVAIRIPSIKVDGRQIMALGLNGDHSLQVPPLKNPLVAGWYTGAPVPGNPGSGIMAAHVDAGGVKGLFYRLSEMKPGDLVFVDRSDGKTAEFKTASVDKYCKDAVGCPAGEKVFPSKLFYSSQPQAQLHLTTCGGRYDAKDRNYLESIVVISTLVSMS